MAKLGTYKIQVIRESLRYSVDATEHEVEKGVNVTDHVKRNNDAFSISGKVVGSKDFVARIDKYWRDSMTKGRVLNYVGGTRFSNVIITNIEYDKDKTVANGMMYRLELREIRIAKSSVKKTTQTAPKQSGGTTQKKPATQAKKRYYVVKKSDTLWAIAKKYYGSPNYQKIYNANKSLIKNVNLIYPGQKFLIPY